MPQKHILSVLQYPVCGMNMTLEWYGRLMHYTRILQM